MTFLNLTGAKKLAQEIFTKAKSVFVEKATGKGLSSNDFTDAYKQKLDGIPADATNKQGTVTSVTLSGTSPINVSDGGTAITVSGTRTISHANSGVTAASRGDTANQTPAFGGTFKALSGTVNKTGHLTAFAEHSVTIPSSVATSGAAGLMSSSDKARLDGIEPGAQVNVVEAVSVNGTAAPLSDKTAALTLTKSTVGLGNVDNTSDLNKPISTATQAALDNKVGKTAGGVGSATKGAYLNSSGNLAPMTYSLETDVPSDAFDPATAAKKGPVKIGSNVNVAADGTISVPDATTAAKGVVKVGTNVSVSNGTISVPDATTVEKGVVKVGTNVSVSNGTISVPDADTSTKGVVKVGDNIDVSSGTVSVKTGSASDKGVLKVGSNIDVDSGTISVKDASTTNKGVMKVGTNLSVTGGTVSVPDATGSVKGVVQVGSNINVSGGVISVPDAGTGTKGVTQLSSATDSEAENLAATPKAVKAAYDLANSKQNAEEGKGLSTNDYTDADKALLDSVQRDIIVTLTPVQSGTEDPSPDNVRPISGFDSVAVTKNGQSVTITLPETVYGGTLNVTMGLLTVTHGYIELVGSNAEYWRMSYPDTAYALFRPGSGSTGIPGSMPAGNGSINSYWCSHFRSRVVSSSTLGMGIRLYIASENNQLIPWIRPDLSIIKSVADWESYLQTQKSKGTPVQVVYELATPITYQLTATGLTAVASDTVSADAGSISFAAYTPAPATAAPLMDGTSAVGTSDEYAREDHVHPTDTSRASQTDLTAQGQSIDKQAEQIALLHELLDGLEVDGVKASFYRSAGPANPVTISDGYPANVKTLSLDIQTVQADGTLDENGGVQNPSLDNIRPITGVSSVTVTRYGENDNSVSIPLTFPVLENSLKIGKGTLELTSDGWLLTVTHVIRTLDGTEVKSDGGDAWAQTAVSASRGKRYNCSEALLGSYPKAPLVCSHCVEGETYTSRTACCKCGTSSITFIIFLPEYRNDTLENFLSYLADHPIDVLYPLETPQTYPLSAQQLATLAGSNTISADAGPVSVTYRADPSLTYEELERNLTNAILSLGMGL